jgi:hypothetical protein
MTNDEDAQKEGNRDKDPSLKIDPLLQNIVSLANETGVGVPVVLSVKGMMIAGDTIKRDEYYNRLIASMGNPVAEARAGTDEKIAKMIAEHFSFILNAFKDLSNKPDESGAKRPPNMIHLENVHITDATTGRPIRLIGALWRGKLESIDGFIFGRPEFKAT